MSDYNEYSKTIKLSKMIADKVTTAKDRENAMQSIHETLNQNTNTIDTS